jgi:GntR family transcriptional regulator/MocR family aminotransferase
VLGFSSLNEYQIRAGVRRIADAFADMSLNSLSMREKADKVATSSL